MGCSQSSTEANNGKGASRPTSKATEDLKRAERTHTKSLSSYDKTKGGSMLFNVSSRNHQNPEDAEFTDDQHIMSPSQPDWKVGKAIKRAPDMKQTHYFKIPEKDESQHVMVACGYKSLQGKNPKPPHKPNQDSLSVFVVDQMPHLCVFSVFDGHGPYGEHASVSFVFRFARELVLGGPPVLLLFICSRIGLTTHPILSKRKKKQHFCRSRFHHSMVNSPNLEKDPVLALKDALHTMHTNFCSKDTMKSKVVRCHVVLPPHRAARGPQLTRLAHCTAPRCTQDPVVSGTTCIAVMFDGTTLHTANVGDSRAIMGTIDKDHNTQIVELSDDHKPQRPDERARLEKSSAILLTERQVRGFGDDSKVYICRKKGDDIVYGVLFTRSLGDADAHEHLGVSAEPEMHTRKLREGDRYIVLASDGVWDYMENSEVMDIVIRVSDPFKAAQEIVDVAVQRWDERDVDRRRDDITVFVIKTELVKKEANADASGAAGADEGPADDNVQANVE